MAFGNIGEIEHALAAKAVTLHTKIHGRFITVDERRQAGLEDLRHHARPHDARRAPAEATTNLPFDVVNKLMTKKEISNMIDAVYRHCGQKETVIFCDRIMALGFTPRLQGRHLVRQGRHGHPRDQGEARRGDARSSSKDYEQQYNDGLITQGEKYNKVVDAWAKCTDQRRRRDDEAHLGGREGRERPREADQLDLHDEPFRRARLAGADEAARRHARPDGQAVGRDHREPDHLELQGRPDRARVLQLDPRRPQGPRRHGAEDGELRLSDAPSRRRGAGLHHHRGGLRHRSRPQDAGDHRCRPGRRHRSAMRILGRTAAEDVIAPATGKVDRAGRHD